MPSATCTTRRRRARCCPLRAQPTHTSARARPAVTEPLPHLSALRDPQRGPSVALRWRTLWRALALLLRRALLAAIDFFGALFIVGAATGKVYAFQLACAPSTQLHAHCAPPRPRARAANAAADAGRCALPAAARCDALTLLRASARTMRLRSADDTMRLVSGLTSATTAGLSTLPWPWRALGVPPLLLGMALPTVLLFAVFALQRLLVVDRAMLVRARGSKAAPSQVIRTSSYLRAEMCAWLRRRGSRRR
jgi:hypothetical protein